MFCHTQESMNPKKIDIVDYIVMVLYVAVGVWIFVMYNVDVPNLELVRMVLIMLTVLGPMSLFFSFYKRFRIVEVWLSWLMIGTLQAIIVIPLRNNPDFAIRELSTADSGLNMLILVLMLPIFRMISRKVTNKEFDVASRFSEPTKAKLSPLDYLLTLLGIVILMTSLFHFIVIDQP